MNYKLVFWVIWKVDMVVYVCKFSFWEDELGGWEFGESSRYIVRSYFKNNE